MRFDLDTEPDDIGDFLNRMIYQHQGTNVLLVIWSADDDRLILPDLDCPIADTIWTNGSVWTSLTCNNDECCKPNSPVVPFDEIVSAHALVGRSALSDRDAVAASIAPGDGVPDAPTQTLILTCENIEARDRFLALAADDPHRFLPAIISSTECCRVESRPALYTVLAAVAYMSGDGCLTRCALDHAGATSLAQLLSAALDSGMSPEIIQNLILASMESVS
jgi:hypothetical protein